MGVKNVLKTVVAFKTISLSILCPILLLPIIYNVDGDAGRCAYGVAILMAFWVFDVFPLAVTSLLPVVLFPVLGVLSAADVSSQYTKTVSLTLVGIFGLVAVVEKWGLHKRMALSILRLFGTKPHWLILGMLTSTAVLSMFITAGVTALMLPIVRSMMDKLKNVNTVKSNDMELEETLDECADPDDKQDSTELEASHDHEIAQLYKALTLCIGYGSSVGSSIMLTGHPTNFITIAFTDEFYRNYGLNSPLTFISWLVMAAPVMVIILILMWIWFVILFLRGKGLFRRASRTEAMQKTELRVKEHIKEEHQSLGPWTYPEVMSLVFLLLLVVIFITEDLYFVPGWGALFKPGFVGSASPACLLAVVLFLVPSKSPKALFCGTKQYTIKKSDVKGSRFTALLTWHDVETCMPWSILLLIGAAFTIVKASKVSGLETLLGKHFDTFATFDPWVLTLVLTLITTFLTEFMSNSATVAMLLPIAAQVALSAGIEPLGLFFPMTLAANFAFMMPVSTPPNAIAYSLGSLRIKDMVTAGFVLNILSLIVVNVAAQTWGKAYFGWDVLPQAMRLNNTRTNISISG